MLLLTPTGGRGEGGGVRGKCRYLNKCKSGKLGREIEERWRKIEKERDTTDGEIEIQEKERYRYK